MTLDPYHHLHAGRITDFLARHRLPGMHQTRDHARAKRRPDLIISDYRLADGKNGIEVQLLKKHDGAHVHRTGATAEAK